MPPNLPWSDAVQRRDAASPALRGLRWIYAINIFHYPSYRSRSWEILLLKQRARFGQVFWCDFPPDAPRAEFHAEQPAVVIRSAKDLQGSESKFSRFER